LSENWCLSVVTDGLHRAAFHGLLAKSLLLRSLGLLKEIGVTSLIIAGKISGRSFATQVAINALVIAVVGACNILGIFIGYISHDEKRLKADHPIAMVFYTML
jgi:hypothetical protein